MNGNTRIEMNAGGLDGLLSIASFGLSLDGLDKDMENVISSFQAVKNEVYNLPGGVGKLGDFVDAMQCRIDNEEEKRQNLNDFADLFSDFLDLATSVDDAVADFVDQNKEEFYQMNPHLRPPVPQPEKNIFEKAGDWLKERIKDVGEAFVALGTAIYEGIVGAVSAAWELIKYVFTEFGGLIVAVLLTIVSVVIVVVAFKVLAGLALFVVAAAGILSGIAAAVTGIRMLFTGETGIEHAGEAARNWFVGLLAGAEIGLVLYGFNQFAPALKALTGIKGGILRAIASGFKNLAVTVGMNPFMQLVVEGKSFAEFSLKEFFADMAISFAAGTIFAGIEEAISGIGKLEKVKALTEKVGTWAKNKFGYNSFGDFVVEKLSKTVLFENWENASRVFNKLLKDLSLGTISEGGKLFVTGEYDGILDLLAQSFKGGLFDTLWSFIPGLEDPDLETTYIKKSDMTQLLLPSIS